jgi:molybdopterin converting factor small subunit
MTMQVNVFFLASLRHSTGIEQCTLNVPSGAKVEQAVVELVSQFPVLDGQQNLWHFAINQTAADADSPLKPGDTISIFPYLGGG